MPTAASPVDLSWGMDVAGSVGVAARSGLWVRSAAMDADTAVAALLHRAELGDQAAWNVLVDRYTNLLWSVGRAHRLDSADAADVVQTTWLRLVEHLDRIEDPERLPGWLVTTARRECLRIIKRSQRELPGGRNDEAFDLPDVRTPALDAHLLDDERAAELWRCFGDLPERCRRLLRVLMAADPPAYAQVAEALGMPVGSIGPTRMRCLDKLRQLVADAGYAFDTAAGGLR